MPSTSRPTSSVSRVRDSLASISRWTLSSATGPSFERDGIGSSLESCRVCASVLRSDSWRIPSDRYEESGNGHTIVASGFGDVTVFHRPHENRGGAHESGRGRPLAGAGQASRGDGLVAG